ncbi:MAG TPA: PfkB family carbohydrate kinase [Gemmatimonadales bacterium]|nr:PfkB family carbohydrate kinase [Gemmatimonadales bacterium]
MRKRLGIIGTMVWDTIHGRDPGAPVVEEWGGITYSLAALDAALDDDWEIVPLIKVGTDLAPAAARFLASLKRVAPGARFIETDAATNRVTLQYVDTARRCETLRGGLPGWTWPELGPMVADLDALYVNFISGHELCRWTAQQLRLGFAGPIYADLHSLFLGTATGGVRVPAPLERPEEWYRCFDVLQVNEDVLALLGDDLLVIAARALGEGVSLFTVTVGPRGAIYVARPGFDRLGAPAAASVAEPVRTARVAAPGIEVLDPTGCGDVFGATCCARLVAGDTVEQALARANAAAARNAAFRGASGLAAHLRGQLVEA